MNENFNYIIKPSKIEGEVKISGAKNSSLRLLAASILTDKKIVLSNCPNELLDVKIHLEMLISLGKKVGVSGDIVEIEESEIKSELVWNKRSIRNTILIAGALLARHGYAKVPLPGGCDLGDRKINLHLMVFEKFGAKYHFEDDFLIVKSEGKLKGCEINLPIRSTGATENALLCATLAKGKTIIKNPHVRPEILDLIEFLKKIGASIKVHGQDFIEVTGCESASVDIIHDIVPDNVEALTWMIMAILHKSKITIYNFPFDHLIIPIQFLREGSSIFEKKGNTMFVNGDGATSFEIATGPYPGINSDMQPIFAAYALFAKGNSVIHDLRFSDRFQYVDELKRLNAVIKVDGNTIKIFPPSKEYTSCNVKATDLRGGVCLAICASLIKGEMQIKEAFQIERGYNNFVEKFKSLGGNIIKEYI
jgi:UDP-N-acetylglucosamine 1-carboxyvinyltransferase